MTNRKWLILSHGFNMDGRAASLTITDKIPHLINEGIEPIVLSAVTGKKDLRFYHRQILPWGPAGLRFDLRHLIAQRYGRGLFYRISTGLASLLLSPFILLERLIIGLQSQWSWTPAAIFWGYICIKRFNPELIYSTGGAYSAHWAAFWLKRISKKPWIAEIHDPMVFPGTVPKTRNLKFWAKLEGMICREADLAWWFTDQAMLSAKRRHPELANKGFVILPGAEPIQSKNSRYEKKEKLRFGHFGSLSESRSAKELVNSFLKIINDDIIKAEEIEFHFYGGKIDKNAKKIILENNLEKYFKEHGRVEENPESGKTGRQKINEIMSTMDCLILLHGNTEDCSEYIPSKIYDYLWSKRPILGLTHKNTQLNKLIIKYSGFIAESTDTYAIIKKINEIYDKWNTNSLMETKTRPIDTKQAVNKILLMINQTIQY